MGYSRLEVRKTGKIAHNGNSPGRIGSDPYGILNSERTRRQPMFSGLRSFGNRIEGVAPQESPLLRVMKDPGCPFEDLVGSIGSHSARGRLMQADVESSFSIRGHDFVRIHRIGDQLLPPKQISLFGKSPHPEGSAGLAYNDQLPRRLGNQVKPNIDRDRINDRPRPEETSSRRPSTQLSVRPSAALLPDRRRNQPEATIPARERVESPLDSSRSDDPGGAFLRRGVDPSRCRDEERETQSEEKQREKTRSLGRAKFHDFDSWAASERR